MMPAVMDTNRAHADAGGAQHNAALAFAGRHGPGRQDAEVGIIAAVRGIGAEVHDLVPQVLEVLAHRPLEGQRAMVTGQRDFHSCLQNN